MNTIETDWENSHQTEQMKAVMGKDMSLAEFWASGEDRYTKMTAPLLGKLDVSEFTVLDIGCGPGRILKPMAQRMKRAIGIDVSGTAVKTAISNLRHLENVQVIKGDGISLTGIEDNSIDLVTSYDVFQHIPTLAIQQNYMAEVARVLKLTGVFVLQVKTDSGWLKVAGMPVCPRRFRKYIPSSFMRIALSRKRGHRLRDTWRGNLIEHKKLKDVFAEQGLRVEHMVPDGRGTRWVVSGHSTSHARK